MTKVEHLHTQARRDGNGAITGALGRVLVCTESSAGAGKSLCSLGIGVVAHSQGHACLPCHDAVRWQWNWKNHLWSCQHLSDSQLHPSCRHKTCRLGAASRGSLVLGPYSRTPVLLSLSFALTLDFRSVRSLVGFIPNHEVVVIQRRLPSLHDGTSEKHRPSEHAGTKPSFRCDRQVVLWGQAHTKAGSALPSRVCETPPHLARTVQWAFLGVFWGGVTESY